LANQFNLKLEKLSQQNQQIKRRNDGLKEVVENTGKSLSQLHQKTETYRFNSLTSKIKGSKQLACSKVQFLMFSNVKIKKKNFSNKSMT
jgi:hypothetical protein